MLLPLPPAAAIDDILLLRMTVLLLNGVGGTALVMLFPCFNCPSCIELLARHRRTEFNRPQICCEQSCFPFESQAAETWCGGNIAWWCWDLRIFWRRLPFARNYGGIVANRRGGDDRGTCMVHGKVCGDSGLNSLATFCWGLCGLFSHISSRWVPWDERWQFRYNKAACFFLLFFSFQSSLGFARIEAMRSIICFCWICSFWLHDWLFLRNMMCFIFFEDFSLTNAQFLEIQTMLNIEYLLPCNSYLSMNKRISIYCTIDFWNNDRWLQRGNRGSTLCGLSIYYLNSFTYDGVCSRLREVNHPANFWWHWRWH